MRQRAVTQRKRGGGRPSLTLEQAAQKAEFIIRAAWALRWAPSQLVGMGLSIEQAQRLVSKRHRGLVGALIGDALPAGETIYPPLRRLLAGPTRDVLDDSSRQNRHGRAAALAAELIDGGMNRPDALRAAIRWHEGNTGRVPGEIDRKVTVDERTVRRLLAGLRPIARK